MRVEHTGMTPVCSIITHYYWVDPCRVRVPPAHLRVLSAHFPGGKDVVKSNSLILGIAPKPAGGEDHGEQ